MRAVSTAMADALAGAIIYPVFLIELDFPSGTLRLGTEMRSRDWNGNTYTGVGWVIGVGNVEEAGEIRATSVTIGLQGNSPELISIALLNVKQNLPGKIWFGLLTPPTGPGQAQGDLVEDPVPVFSGLLDMASIGKDPKAPTVTLSYKTRLADLQRVRIRRYTHEDQQIDHPGDLFFQYVGALADKPLNWGLGFHPNAVR